MGGILNKLFSGSSGGSHSAETGCNVFKQHHLTKKSKQRSSICSENNENNNTDSSNHNLNNNNHRRSNYHRHSNNKVVPEIISNNNNNNNNNSNNYNQKNDDDDSKTNSKVTAEEMTMTDDEELNSLEPSPFQRDFGQHQILVSLEKHRPRRSNIRRSSRNPNKNNSNVPTPDGDKLPVNAEPSLPNSQSNKLSMIRDVSFTDDSDSLPTISIETGLKLEPQIEKDDSEQQAVDELAPNERQKVARSRISDLFLKRQTLQMPISLGNELSRQNGFDNDNNDCDNNTVNNSENILESASNSSGEQSPQTPSSPELKNGDNSEKIVNIDKRLSLVDIENNSEEMTRTSEVVPRRRPKTMAFGNPLLIDELKKRQSTFHVDVNQVN